MPLNITRHTTVAKIQVLGQPGSIQREREQPDERTTCRFETNQQMVAVAVVSGPFSARMNAHNKPDPSIFHEVIALEITSNPHELHHTKESYCVLIMVSLGPFPVFKFA